MHPGGQRRGRRGPAHVRHQLRHLVLLEAAQLEHLAHLLPHQLAQCLGQRMPRHQRHVAQRRDHDDACRPQFACQELQQPQRRRVRAVQVVEHDHQGPAGGAAQEDPRHGIEEPKTGLVAFARGHRAQGRKPLAEVRNHGRDLRGV